MSVTLWGIKIAVTGLENEVRYGDGYVSDVCV